MFDLTLRDHLRLTFGHVIYSHKTHMQTAERLSSRAFVLKFVELGLLALTTALAVGVLMGGGRAAAIAAAVFSAAALVLFVVLVTWSLEPMIYAHRTSGVRLWLIREKYRSLLADLADGTVDPMAARERRDALMRELHAVYEHAPMTDRRAYQAARQDASMTDEVALSDEEVDHFLPASMRKSTA